MKSQLCSSALFGLNDIRARERCVWVFNLQNDAFEGGVLTKQREPGQSKRFRETVEDGPRIHLIDRERSRHLGSSERGPGILYRRHTACVSVYFMEHFMLEGTVCCIFEGATDHSKILNYAAILCKHGHSHMHTKLFT